MDYFFNVLEESGIQIRAQDYIMSGFRKPLCRSVLHGFRLQEMYP